MATFGDDLVAAIEDACAHFDRPQARALVEQLSAQIRDAHGAFPSDRAKRALTALRRKRYFDTALRLADVIFESGQNASILKITYAQALIDSGAIASSIPYLESALHTMTPRSHASNEARGLVGRAYKQLYVNRGGDDELRRDYLLRAFNAYYDAWTDNPSLTWHGINAIAVLHRARRDQQKLPDVEGFEQRVFDRAIAQVNADPSDLWGYATAGEAAIALGRYDKARELYAIYATDRTKIDAFELASSLRQLVEVWQLSDDKDPGAEILPLLRSELLRREGGAVTLSPREIHLERAALSDERLEKTFGAEGAVPLTWYRTGTERSLPVCRISNVFGKPWGTGFIVRGGDFCERLGDERMVLTNDHVVSRTTGGALLPDRAVLKFEALEDPTEYKSELVWGSPVRECDASLLRITPPLPEKAGTCPISNAHLQCGETPPTRVYVIGHPQGGPMAISLFDNELLDLDDRVMHYRAPTEKGNSGSPVFDKEWEVVALHHAGSATQPRLNGHEGTYEANEGICIQAVKTACAAALE